MSQVNGLTPRAAEIAGLRPRFFAFFIDGLILGAVGAGMGLIAFDRLVALGDWGRLVGFVIALLYFGVMDSKLCGGQTFGKQVVGLKVVTASGAPLGIGASMLRAAIFCVPYFLNNSFVAGGAAVAWLAVLLVFGLGISIVYLLLFNRQTRQSLHDLAVGAYVVRYEAHGSIGATGGIWPVHFRVVAVIMGISLVLPYFARQLEGSPSVAKILSLQRELQKEPGVRHVTLTMGVEKYFASDQPTKTTHVLNAKILFATKVTDFDSLANSAVQDLLSSDPTIARQDMISITIVYGYDIGISSAWRSQHYALSPAQWQQRLSAGQTRL